MKQLSFIYLLIVYLFLPIAGHTKAILLNEDSGLNNIEVTALAKDKSGMMWVATKRGLSKYDGYRFTAIQRLEGFVVNTVLYDSIRDRMWVGTDRGLFYVTCGTSDVFQCTRIDEKNAITCLQQYNQYIIVGFRNKYVLKIDADQFTSKVLCYFKEGTLSAANMVQDSSGSLDLFIRKPGSLLRIDMRSGVVEQHTFLNSNIAFLATVSQKLFSGGVNVRIQNLRGATQADQWYMDTLFQIRQDPECMIAYKRSIVIAYRNPIRIIEINLDRHEVSDLTNTSTQIIDYKRINCVFRDAYDITWIGTSKGLVKLIPDKLKPDFEKILSDIEPKHISTRQIVSDEDGNLFVGSYSGMYQYQKTTNSWIKTIDKIFFKGSERPFYQRSLLDAGNGFVYMGADANYFVCYNIKTKVAENLAIQAANGQCNTEGAALALAQDANGLIWMGTEGGLLTFDQRTSALQCHIKDKYDIDGSFVRCLFMMPGKKQFWAGTETGIYLVDIVSGTKAHYDMRTTPALTGNFINGISVNEKGEVWIATGDAGVNVLSADHSSVYTITKEDGLSSNEIYNMLWQDSSRVWISTYNGLNYYQIPTHSVQQYFKSDGVADNEFNQNSAYRAPDGKMYFGGVNGITAFYPPDMELHEQPFEVFVSGITKWEKATGTIVNVTAHDKEIEIEPGDNLLTFSFAVTDFTHPELHTYYYKIDGDNTDWIPLGSQPTLRLESLKGGTHNLMVKAVKGSRGQASLNTLVYHLNVNVEFYRTVWFYLLILVGFAGLIYLYYSYRLKTQQKLELLRIKIASNLHDEVGSLLTRITMSADRLVTRMPRDSETRDKLEGVSALSREANVAMSDVLWTIDARNDFTGSLTDRMREHAEDLLLPRGIDVSIDFSEIDQLQKLSPEFRQHLFLLYKELINNIIKHSRAEQVNITYKQTKSGVLLIVKNDGVTWQNDAVITGQGLRNIRMRAEMIRGFVDFIKGEHTFEVKIMI